ncbi:MAG: hypothetical protein RLZZ58_486 [Pseudomonadota bacterium]
MSGLNAIIVLDVGKTLSKLSLWSADGVLIDKRTRLNAPYKADGAAVLDVVGIGDWVRATLPPLAAQADVAAIIPVGHGAGVAAIRDGALAFAPLDYEQPIPNDVMAGYRAQRDAFARTGSPALPHGLNIGSQLHWLEARDADSLNGVQLVPWAQYWAWFLSGSAVSEVTSLGCHSDLWSPATGDFSDLARRRGWAAKFAPLVRAGEIVGQLKPAFGLGASVDVYAGIHDSNAALVAARGFAEISGAEATILSTGTWFVAMRSPASPVDLAALPEARDCLVNVDAGGAPVPSARWMGGREMELLGARIESPGLDGLADVLMDDMMILPNHVAGSGPFPRSFGRWINRQEDADMCRAAAALYAALMTDVALDLIGAGKALLIEGRFARAELFVRALATLRPDTHVFVAADDIDVAFGALRLVLPGLAPRSTLTRVAPLDRSLDDYRAEWHDDIAIFA